MQPDWSIATTISNILDLRKLFLNCRFSCVRRCYNTVAHVAAKFAFRCCGACCFNMYCIPAVIADACKADSLYFAC